MFAGNRAEMSKNAAGQKQSDNDFIQPVVSIKKDPVFEDAGNDCKQL